ncbi:hypothetical protein HYW32_04470 [Candidatus Berkelbacteria bacterium]|nr:hypothetical protein [Candidatus Berkelbacteria bacterium]
MRWVLAIFIFGGLLYGTAWWFWSTNLPFNPIALIVGGGILFVNAILTLFFVKKELFLGYIFGGFAVFAEILLLILLFMADRGVL